MIGVRSTNSYSADRLRAARPANISYADVAAMTGKPEAIIADYERGVVIPTASVLGVLATLYGVPVELLYDPDDPADAVTAFTAEIRASVEAAPRLTAEQQAQLRVILRGAS